MQAGQQLLGRWTMRNEAIAQLDAVIDDVSGPSTWHASPSRGQDGVAAASSLLHVATVHLVPQQAMLALAGRCCGVVATACQSKHAGSTYNFIIYSCVRWPKLVQSMSFDQSIMIRALLNAPKAIGRVYDFWRRCRPE